MFATGLCIASQQEVSKGQFIGALFKEPRKAAFPREDNEYQTQKAGYQVRGNLHNAIRAYENQLSALDGTISSQDVKSNLVYVEINSRKL